MLRKFALTGKVNCFKISPNGYIIAISIDKTIYLYDFYTQKQIAILNKHFKPITCLEFTNDSSHLVSGSADSQIFAWRIHDHFEMNDITRTASVDLKRFSGHHNIIKSIKIGYGGASGKLYSAGLDNTIKVIFKFFAAEMYFFGLEKLLRSECF